MTDIFRAKTGQTPVFKTVVDALKEFLTDINLECNPPDPKNPEDKGNIKIVAVDSTQTVLIHLKLEGKNFSNFVCKKRIIIGLSMVNFHKIIKTVSNNNDCLTLYVNEEDEDKLGILVENNEKNSVTKFKLNLIDMTQEDIAVPKQDFDSTVTMPSSDFQKVCRDMHSISETISITNINDKLIFSCQGDFANQETEFTQGEQDSGLKFGKSNEKYKIIQGNYSLKHLVQFTKCTGLSSHVQLFMRNDYPLIIQYKVGGLGYLKLIIAPKKK